MYMVWCILIDFNKKYAQFYCFHIETWGSAIWKKTSSNPVTSLPSKMDSQMLTWGGMRDVEHSCVQNSTLFH